MAKYAVIVILVSCLCFLSLSLAGKSSSSSAASSSSSAESAEFAESDKVAKSAKSAGETEELARDLISGKEIGLQCYFGTKSTDERLGLGSFEVHECPRTQMCATYRCEAPSHWTTVVKSCVAVKLPYCEAGRALCQKAGGLLFDCTTCAGNLCNGGVLSNTRTPPGLLLMTVLAAWMWLWWCLFG